MNCSTNCQNCSFDFRKERFNTIKNSYQIEDLNKFNYNFEEYSRPYSMLLGLTNDCNLACNYCFVKQ